MGTSQSNARQDHRPRPSLRVVCAVVAIMGLAMLGRGVWNMDLTGMGVGMLMLFAAVAGDRAFGSLARIKSRLCDTNERLEDIRAGLSGVESPVSQSIETSQDEPGMPPIEMVNLSGGDPRLLTAATLDGSTFPRLATLLNEAAVESASDLFDEHPNDSLPSVVAAYETPDETEMMLRQEFSQRARCRDYAGLLDVGRRICKLLPDRPIATEYERLEPALIRKAAAAQSDRKARGAQPSSGAIVFDHSRRASG